MRELGAGEPLAAAFTVPADVVAPFVELTFDASPSYSRDAVIVEYLWDFGDGGEDEGKVVVYSYFDLGVFQVTLTVVD
ncbi:MAG: PKD domain-containing protein, partial [Candidatus Bipolaricaulota bacterium]|nr:PKD domain-containing protein [Candidatus Bipolaricaulota bacterium]MDW8127573.1 PKD domain-containing protein [Candidatus Bipolaricaulota bacterium]